MKRSRLLLLLLLVVSVSSFGQSGFHYRRLIGGVEKEAWYSMPLPSDLFSDVNRNLSDLRLYSLHAGDTSELPYILDVKADEMTKETVELPLFNKSFRDDVLYLTFELEEGQKVNYIDLKFSNVNYFGMVSLEGSDDGKQWFEIIRDQRIVAIRKGEGDYVSSTVNFPLSEYRLLRFSVKSDVELNFGSASFQYRTIRPGRFNDIPLTWKMLQDKKTKRSIVDIRLAGYVPLSSIRVRTDSAALFYRPMQIEYVRDSARTEKGWIKYYENVYDGHLSSYKANIFDFDWKLVRELRLVVFDSDNAPLKIHEITAHGPEIHLVALLKPGNNFMLYGAHDVGLPSYDLVHFQNRIPEIATTAVFAAPEKILFAQPGDEPLFKNKLWLWALLTLMILLMGYFTVKMMKQKNTAS